jgi:hypothetical protein
MTRSEAGWLGAIKIGAIRKQQAIDRYNAQPNLCVKCGTIISLKNDNAKHSVARARQKKFCNQSCAASYNNRKRIRKIRLCVVCNAPINPGAKSYCSLSCFRSVINYDFIFDRGVEVRSSTLRRAMLRSGLMYKCALCGIGPEWNRQNLVLQADHKNGSSCDNKKDNLRFLCPNCHSQTPTYGSRNIGYGRPSRRKKMERQVGFEPTN